MLIQEQFRAFFAQSVDAIFVVELRDASTVATIVECNDAACRLYGYVPERFIGLPVSVLSAEHRASTPSDALTDALNAGRARLETLHRRADGASLAVDLSLTFVPPADARRIFITARDITRHRVTERRLAAQHAISRVLAEAPHFMEAAPQMLQIIGEQLDWAQSLLWCVDYEAGLLRYTMAWRGPDADEAFDAASRQLVFGPGDGLPGKVWASGAPVWVEDLHTLWSFPRVQAAEIAGLKSAFAFPILGHAGVFGVMEFFSRELRPSEPALIEMAHALGTQSGQYIERRRAETALRASDARKGAVLSAALDGIISIDHRSRITEFNPAAERIFGYRFDEVAGRDMADVLIPSRLREQHRRGMERHLATGTSHLLGTRVELAALRADGSEFPIELTITRIPNDGPPLFTGFVRDISDRKRAEDRTIFLAEASSLLAASLDYETTLATLVDLAVPRLADWCSINIVNADGAFVRVAGKHVDPAKEAILQRLREQYPPDPARPLMAGGSVVPERATLIPELTDGELARLAQHPEQLRTYREVGFRSAMLVPLRAGTRQIGMLVLITGESGRRYGPEDLALAEDLASRAALAIDNAHLYRAEQAAVHIRDEFLSVAAHELKTPVTALVGYAQILQRRAMRTASEREQRAFDTLVAQSDRLANLVATLLDVSRIQMGTFVLERQLVDVCTLTSHVVEEFQTSLLAGSRHSLELVCPEKSLMVNGDTIRLGQVFRNLIQNAIKYSPRGGLITVSISHQGEHAIVAVQDRGLGIPQEAQKRLFQRFYRAPNIADMNISGMGIGLFVVHEIVNRHGGTIEVESTEGEGSTFSIHLPLVSPPVPGVDAETRTP
jgi:PAS domain S-box-containing protein